METSTDNAPLIVIVGPTASGKSALALQIAQRFKGEIISADSRTVYQGVDVGTAKPSQAQRALVPHHLLDVVKPDIPFSVADFKRQATACINEISSRGKLPIMVGGTGLYVDALLFDFSLRSVADPKLRTTLQQLTVEELQGKLLHAGVALPENARNPRHLIRSIETKGELATLKRLRKNTLIVGVEVEPQVLKARIEDRVTAMFQAGLEIETRQLSKRYGWTCKALRTIGYREFEPYFKGLRSLAETRQQIVRDTNAYAKRQRTWFARNKSIHWASEKKKIEDLITTFLSK